MDQHLRTIPSIKSSKSGKIKINDHELGPQCPPKQKKHSSFDVNLAGNGIVLSLGNGVVLSLI